MKQGENPLSKDRMDISLVCLNTQSDALEIAYIKNLVWTFKTNKGILEIKPGKQSIDYTSADHQHFLQKSIVPNKRDVIYKFTDGYANRFGGEKGKKSNTIN